MTDPDNSAQNEPSKPPLGDFKKAQDYINKLVRLISQDKLKVVRTDLKRFDPTTLQNHYRLDLRDYQIEVSHSKDPNSGKDSYVMVFTNLATLSQNPETNQKVILAYLHLNQDLFGRFKNCAEEQLEKVRRLEEEKRFNQVMEPINRVLENIEEKPEPKEQYKPEFLQPHQS